VAGTQIKSGGKQVMLLNAWPRSGEGEYIYDKYAMCKVAI
jgi:hypothetical protein